MQASLDQHHRSNVIAFEIEVLQLPALSQHSCKSLCPVFFKIEIAAEIQMSQRWTLCQHSKSLFMLSFYIALRQLECADAAQAVINVSCLITECSF